MATRAEAFTSGRFYLPTANLTDPTTKFGNVTPAFNNNYDVMIHFDTPVGGLKQFILKHGFYDQNGGSNSPFSPGSYLSLFCSEAVLPGSDIQSSQVDGLRQGISQKYATFRRFPDIILTYYLQTDYYTNEVFNAWMEYISPTRTSDGTFGSDTDRRKTAAASGGDRGARGTAVAARSGETAMLRRRKGGSHAVSHGSAASAAKVASGSSAVSHATSPSLVLAVVRVCAALACAALVVVSRARYTACCARVLLGPGQKYQL